MNVSNDLQELIEDALSILLPLKEGEFSEKINKVSMYLNTIEKSSRTYDAIPEPIQKQLAGEQGKRSKYITARAAPLKASIGSSIRFARMNLNLAMAQALDKLIRRPKNANKVDESKRKRSLSEWFDQLIDPVPAMLEHFKESSNPLDKWLVAGQWGHEYLGNRHIDLEAYDRNLCELIPCSDRLAIMMVLNYGKLNNAIDAVEEISLKALSMPEKETITK